MSWGDALEAVDYLAVLAGTIVSLVVGFVWYNPKGFGSKWGELVGLKKKDMESPEGMGVKMSMSIGFYFLVSLTLAAVYEMTGVDNSAEAALTAAILAFVFAFGPLAVTYAYAKRKFDLTAIDGGYMVTTVVLMGLVIQNLS